MFQRSFRETILVFIIHVLFAVFQRSLQTTRNCLPFCLLSSVEAVSDERNERQLSVMRAGFRMPEIVKGEHFEVEVQNNKQTKLYKSGLESCVRDRKQQIISNRDRISALAERTKHSLSGSSKCHCALII